LLNSIILKSTATGASGCHWENIKEGLLDPDNVLVKIDAQQRRDSKQLLLI
jgi:hypothetical protein